MTADRVFIKNLLLASPVIGLDRWKRALKPQPALVSVSIPAGGAIAAAAADDDIARALDYSALCKALQALDGDRFPSADELVGRVAAIVLRESAGRDVSSDDDRSVDAGVAVELRLPMACPWTDSSAGTLGGNATGGGGGGVAVTHVYAASSTPNGLVCLRRTVSFANVALSCVIGINPHERERSQPVRVDVSLTGAAAHLAAPALAIDALEPLVELVRARGDAIINTVEHLATRLADTALVGRDREGRAWDEVVVSVEKPHAYATVLSGPGVVVTRHQTSSV